MAHRRSGSTYDPQRVFTGTARKGAGDGIATSLAPLGAADVARIPPTRTAVR